MLVIVYRALHVARRPIYRSVSLKECHGHFAASPSAPPIPARRSGAGRRGGRYGAPAGPALRRRGARVPRPPPQRRPAPGVLMATIPWLVDVLRGAGVQVVVEGNWLARMRPGSFDPIGVLWHHTAATSSASN